MAEIFLRRTVGGFVPDSEADQDRVRKFKMGEVVRAKVSKPRNLKFFRKWWGLVTVGFEMWQELGVRAEFKGEEVRPNIERFRKDVTILAGHFHPVVNLRGELRLEADSIAFDGMAEETFEALYNETLAVLVHKVMRGKVTEEKLREMAEQIEAFA